MLGLQMCHSRAQVALLTTNNMVDINLVEVVDMIRERARLMVLVLRGPRRHQG